MTRERWEQILFAHVPDDTVQDMLNAYVLELEAENDKLRKQGARLFDKTLELGTENAKLRELLKDTLPFIAEETGYCVTADCFVYPACCDNNGDEECPAVTRIHERARELGIEDW